MERERSGKDDERVKDDLKFIVCSRRKTEKETCPYFNEIVKQEFLRCCLRVSTASCH